ncbi:SidA/IucD/PvdA family monooxygenase [Brevundimonas variabilis]|uniref:Mycobactin lysine-N-oxygenase n=1 Tax=Brevundimonas variabilis TaxID=74312 RepID=A0A7W9FER6_9CAUL|nr:SidA/IucD/PvdA family monooxygenase [Brevundimonas variabilis]MBB5746560.1 mycobactin lysine-N-oxygenase [Brevundimonas variabilis]
MTDKMLAIVGGGPKAAAICAKVACLRALYQAPITTVVFEKEELGAHWRGDAGYTDGVQLLCTPAERDLGFPYGGVFGTAVASRMFADHSWAAHLVQAGDYGRWVSDGRRRPSHGLFADYVAGTIRQTAGDIHREDVTSLRREDGAWTVGFVNDDGQRDGFSGFDGVVITGSGPPLAVMGDGANSRRVYDGASFWTFREEIRDIARRAEADEADEDLVIIGAGGTAAAIAGWLVKAGVRKTIRIIGSQPTLYARADSAFENRMFENIEVWRTLSFAKRREFCDRLTRGAVWQAVIEDLTRADNVLYTPGTATGVQLEDAGDSNGALVVTYDISKDPTPPSKTAIPGPPVSAFVVIDARGFDGWWFRDWLVPSLRDRIGANPAGMEEGMAEDLSLPLGRGAPNLHAPGHSRIVHPGYSSLMSLGDMADAILRPYVKAHLDAQTRTR